MIARFSPIIKKLVDAGVIPPNCTGWSMHATVDGVVIMTYEVVADTKQAEQAVAAALEHPDAFQTKQNVPGEWSELIAYNLAMDLIDMQKKVAAYDRISRALDTVEAGVVLPLHTDEIRKILEG